MSYDVVNDISNVYNDIVTPRNDIVIDIGTGLHDMQSMSHNIYYDMAMSITTSSGRGATSITTWGAIPRGLQGRCGVLPQGGGRPHPQGSTSSWGSFWGSSGEVFGNVPGGAPGEAPSKLLKKLLRRPGEASGEAPSQFLRKFPGSS